MAHPGNWKLGISLLASCSALAIAQPIRVLTLDQSRVGTCSTLEYEFVGGNFYEDVRDALLDPANFGDAGVVDRPIELLEPTPRLRGPDLENADVVLISVIRNGLLSPCEIQLLEDFIRDGGGLFYFENQSMCRFGTTIGTTGNDVGSGDALITDPSNPVADGPFGQVTGTLQVAFHLVMDDLGPSGSEFAASSGTVGASFEVDAGRVVLFGDEEVFTTVIVNGCADGGLTTNERTLFLNTVAWIAPPPGFQYVSDVECCDADVDGDGDADADDFFRYLDGFASGELTDCDVTLNCTCDADDFFGFLDLFAAGC